MIDVDTAELRRRCDLPCRKSVKHGDARGSAGTRLYKVWQNMKGRCETPTATRYKHYGGRGISVCSEWHDYSAFKAWALNNGYSDDLLLDRIDNDGDYNPNNCRFVDRYISASNTRNATMLTVNGETACLAEWARRTGKSHTLYGKHLKKHGEAETVAMIQAALYDRLRALAGKEGEE